MLALSCLFLLTAAVLVQSVGGLEERAPRFEVERDPKRLSNNQNRFRNGGRTRMPKQKAASSSSTTTPTSPAGETPRPRFGQLIPSLYSYSPKSGLTSGLAGGGDEATGGDLWLPSSSSSTTTSTQQPQRSSEFLKGKSKLNCANFVAIFTFDDVYFVCTNRSL